MRLAKLAAAVMVLAWVHFALAQEPAKPPPPLTEEKLAETTHEQPEAPTELFQCGEWWQWAKMTGHWGGVRCDLAEHGITVDMDVTQIIQDNAHGGVSTKNGFRYSGSADLTIKLDTGKMGLWPGGQFLLNAEPKWGNGVNAKVGLLPVNFDAVKPNDEQCEMALSEWIYFQSLLDNKVVLIAGKLDGSRAFDRNAFANDERTQFMNLGLRNNPMIGAFLPYTNLGVGIVLNPLDWLSISTAVADAEGAATQTGFDTTFHGPTHTTVIHEWDVKVKPFDKEGNYRLGFVWSSNEFNHLQPQTPFAETGPLLMKMIGPKRMAKISPFLPYDTSPDNVAIYANFDQWVYNECEDPTQGIGLFGRFGWARQDVNPIAHFYSIGLGGRGVIPDRDKDTCGIGYYYNDLSNNLPSFLTDEQAIEAYYNIEITPWLHISPDFQIVIKPGGTEANDVALVWGIRFQVNL